MDVRIRMAGTGPSGNYEEQEIDADRSAYVFGVNGDQIGIMLTGEFDIRTIAYMLSTMVDNFSMESMCKAFRAVLENEVDELERRHNNENREGREYD